MHLARDGSASQQIPRCLHETPVLLAAVRVLQFLHLSIVRINVVVSFGASGVGAAAWRRSAVGAGWQLCGRLPSAAGRCWSWGALRYAWAGDGDKDACDLAALAKGRTS
jgi:hypothetical protein